jgi:hypothetical protein
MQYYEPFQNLSYVYLKATNSLFIGSSLQVLVDKLEGMGSYSDFPAGTNKAKITLMVQRDYLQDSPNVIMQQVLNKIMESVPAIPYDAVKEPDYFKESLRKVVEADLKNKKAAFFTVTANVYKLDGTPGGTVTNTISTQGGIEII